MKSRLLTLWVALAFGIPGFARDYADAATAAESLRYLEAEKALAISATEMYFDGGSLSFTFIAQDGKKMIFVLSAENQRKEQKRLLSVYQNRRIFLMPDASYDAAATLLREKVAAGIASGLQQKWPAFREDAEMLCLLLKEGGHAKDLQGFYAIAAKRAKKANTPNPSSQPTPGS